MATRKRKKPHTALGALIAERLRVLDRKQTWLEEHVGVSKQAMHKWLYGKRETGEVEITRRHAAALARALGVPVDMVHAAAGDLHGRLPGAAGGVGAPPSAHDTAEWRLVEAYRQAEEHVRLAVRVMLGIEGSDPSSDPRLRKGAPPPARSTSGGRQRR